MYVGVGLMRDSWAGGHIRKGSTPGHRVQRVTSHTQGECVAREKRALSKLREHPDVRHGQRKRSPHAAGKDQGVGWSGKQRPTKGPMLPGVR